MTRTAAPGRQTTAHPLDGSRTPDVEDFEERVALVMDGERLEDEREAQRIVLAQRLDAAHAKQQQTGQRGLFTGRGRV